MLLRFVIAFLPWSKHLLNFMPGVTVHGNIEVEEKKICHSPIFPSYLAQGDGTRFMIFILLMLSFKPALSHSSFTFIRRLFSFSSSSTIRLISSAYLSLLIFLLVILTPACDSSSPAFHTMGSTQKLNKQGDNI